MVGNLDKYMKYQTGVAMEAGAANPGGAAGAGIGMGAGLAMGQQMANSMQGSAASGPAASGIAASGASAGGAMPPPLAAAAEYHVAIDGEATGPFSRAGLQQQLQNGSLQKDTLVWTAGMEDWSEAGRVEELAELFVSKAPPPLPAS